MASRNSNSHSSWRSIHSVMSSDRSTPAGGLTSVVAGAFVGLALDALLADASARPAGAIATLARIIDAERPA